MSAENPQIFSQNDYEIVKREVLCQAKSRFVRYHLRHLLFNGEWTDIFTRDIVERCPAAGVLPYDPLLDQVILIEQFRTGAIANPANPWLIEIVAGLIDQEETAAAVARREANEEAGCKILDLYPICDYFVSPGGSNEYLYLFCGRIDASNANGFFGLKEEHEDIRAFCVTADEAFVMVQEGKIKTGPAILALQWLQLNREWLKQLWQTK